MIKIGQEGYRAYTILPYSLFVVNFKAYEHTTNENSKEALKEAINKYGIPREVMTDHGTQFTSLPSEGKESEPNEFQKYLEEMGITHIKVRGGIHRQMVNWID